ncbi:MAG: acetyl-CoA C-acetyltransferase [Actinomycetales bacterium]
MPVAAPRPVAILGGNRIPFARAGGAYAQATNLDMLIAALDGLAARFGLAGVQIGEVAGGAVLKHPRDFNLTREAVLGSPLNPLTPAFDLQQACGTSLETTAVLAGKIALGQIDSAIAAGVDSTSDAPVVVTDDLRHTLVALQRAKTPRDRLRVLSRLRPSHLAPVPPRTDEPRTGLSMGDHMALTAAAWGITRQAQDELTVASHHNLAAGYERGFFDDLITEYLGLTRDQNLRPDSSMQALAKLKPVFGTDGADPTMTAGNSTPLTDGAAAVLLSTDEWARERGLPVLAHLIDVQTAAVDFVHGEEGLLMAPAYAVPQLLARNNLTLDDFDFVEIHEAFAATPLTHLAAWQDADFCRTRLGLPGPLGSIDRARLNVVGSSLATGHPFAATGARIVATLAKLLHEKGSGRGLISICAAGGLGVTAILEAA